MTKSVTEFADLIFSVLMLPLFVIVVVEPNCKLVNSFFKSPIISKEPLTLILPLKEYEEPDTNVKVAPDSITISLENG